MRVQISRKALGAMASIVPFATVEQILQLGVIVPSGLHSANLVSMSRAPEPSEAWMKRQSKLLQQCNRLVQAPGIVGLWPSLLAVATIVLALSIPASTQAQQFTNL